MRMGFARAAHPARARGAGARRFSAAAGCRRSKDRQLLRQFRRTAARTGRSLPFGRTDEHFAVVPALVTMKFIDWHCKRVAQPAKNLKPLCFFVALDERERKAGNVARHPWRARLSKEKLWRRTRRLCGRWAIARSWRGGWMGFRISQF